CFLIRCPSMKKECMLLHVAQASPACEFRRRPGARTLTRNEKLPNEPILNIAICLKIKGILKVSTFTPKKRTHFSPVPRRSTAKADPFLRFFADFCGFSPIFFRGALFTLVSAIFRRDQNVFP